ncbi:hypothetical protein FY004_03625 [Streptomyces parvus]|uniref:Uncharacterized protein n=1 Tax=Streptomyces parvus TaxID=66428 RepID=A0A5D4JLB9_9ACTN|nr:hypothetical protein FY004_03625 [Streptomyces parvus]
MRPPIRACTRQVVDSGRRGPPGSHEAARRKVYAFPEASSGYVPLHRDVESRVYALVEFRKLEVDHDNDVDPEELEHGIGRPPPGATAPAIRGSRHVSSLSVRVKRGCGPNSSGRNSHGNVPPSRRISRCVFVPPWPPRSAPASSSSPPPPRHRPRPGSSATTM